MKSEKNFWVINDLYLESSNKSASIFDISFILIIILIFIFVLIFILLFYNPYKYIIIDSPDNRENAFYYFFLIDRNKHVFFFLEEKIKEHIAKCDSCTLCTKYQELINTIY